MTDAAKGPPRLVIFGDSHYACVRQAHNLAMVDTSGVEIEYWGHLGSRFRFLSCQNGEIVPMDDYTADRFAKFNDKGRRSLPVSDFDMVVFIGARIYVLNLVIRLVQARAAQPPISTGLQRRLIRDHLMQHRFYQFAQDFAKSGNALIFLTPVAFLTQGHAEIVPGLAQASGNCTAEDRAEIWDLIRSVAREDGIEFFPQPDETVVDGLFTSTAYAVDRYLERKDYEHRGPAYGALILAAAIARLRERHQVATA